MNIKNEYQDLTKNSNKQLSLTILFATLILFVYCYFGTYSFFEKTFPNCKNLDFYKIIYHNTMSFILFFGVGTIFTKFVLKQSLSENGLNLKNSKFMLRVMLLALIIVPLLALSTTLDKQMCNTYPLVNFNTFNEWYYILTYFISYFLYYVGWEYLFRGVLFFNLKQNTNPITAILVTTLISSLIHTSIAGFGKPLVETLSAIPAGLIFGYLTYKTDNIYSSLYCHTLTGFLTDLFIVLIVH